MNREFKRKGDPKIIGQQIVDHWMKTLKPLNLVGHKFHFDSDGVWSGPLVVFDWVMAASKSDRIARISLNSVSHSTVAQSICHKTKPIHWASHIKAHLFFRKLEKPGDKPSTNKRTYPVYSTPAGRSALWFRIIEREFCVNENACSYFWCCSHVERKCVRNSQRYSLNQRAISVQCRHDDYKWQPLNRHTMKILNLVSFKRNEWWRWLLRT